MKETVLITGASSGIGKVFALEYAKLGKNLVLTARSEDKLKDIKKELEEKFSIEVKLITMDLIKENSAKLIYEEIEREKIQIDILVNNAGFGISGEFHTRDFLSQRDQIMLNNVSLVDLTYYIIQGMKKNGKGIIINIASTAAFQPLPYMSVYAATKAFVLSFSEGLYEEYKSYGIKVTAVCPGPTSTNFFDTAGLAGVGEKRTPESVVKTTFKALGKDRPYIVDGKINYMVSQLSRFLTRKRTISTSGKVMRKILGEEM